MIRPAAVEDFDAILDMASEFWCHTQFSESFEREHTRLMVEMCYNDDLLAVADNDGIVGFIAAIKSPLLGSPYAIMATEIAWWVNPESRNSRAGIDLIKFLERLCKKQGVKYLNVAFMESSMPDRIKRLYLSLGYKLEETIYTKVL